MRIAAFVVGIIAALVPLAMGFGLAAFIGEGAASWGFLAFGLIALLGASLAFSHPRISAAILIIFAVLIGMPPNPITAAFAGPMFLAGVLALLGSRRPTTSRPQYHQ